MNIKKFYLSLLTLLLLSPNAKIKADNNTNLILGTTITGLAVWLIGEKVHKHYINKELNKYKQKKYEIEESENLISNSEKHLKYLNQNFNIFNNYSTNLVKFNTQISSTENINILIERYNQNNKFINSLKIKSLNWKQKNKSEFLKKAQDLILNLKKWTPLFYNSLKYYKTLKNIHDLKALSKNIESTYKQEMAALNNFSDKSRSDKSRNKYKLIDLAILKRFNSTEYYFPRISFVKRITEDINNLKTLTNNSYEDYKENYNNLMTHIELEIINSQSNLILNLEKIKNIVCTGHDYILEKKEKPKFDRDQELLNIKIKEREAKIYAEKERNRILLEQEKNQAKAIENQCKEQNIRDKKIKLELERIQSGQVLRKNNAVWQKKIDSIKAIQNDIKNQLTEIATIDLGDNPPYNPQSKHYINYLKEKIKRLINKLN